MRFLRRLLPRSIVAQIALLVTAAILLSHTLTGSVITLFIKIPRPDQFAGNVVTITQLIRAAGSLAEAADVIAMAHRSGIAVRPVELAKVIPLKLDAPGISLFDRFINYRLEPRAGIPPPRRPRIQIFLIQDVAAPSGPKGAIVVPLDDVNALVFDLPINAPLFKLIGGATAALTVISLFIILASVYAVRWITSPLLYIASAARAFGRSPAEDELLPENGPREIVQVAQAMNDMRKRIRALVSDRNRMLAAMSHDLRTPLTRLRLRAERLTDADTLASMLRDIATVNDMLGETLIYLREGVRTEPVQRVDLPSLLQTVCAGFTDMGRAVAYEGPQRFAFACRRGALTRAVSNIVDNAVKNASSVSVRLHVGNDYEPQIEICDDGPGIDAAIRDKVFEPFFKGDTARPSDPRGSVGFGLGLSIARDIVREHDGEIELLDRAPTGLIVRIILAAARRAAE
jgi:signal transduction histidine kinase